MKKINSVLLQVPQKLEMQLQKARHILIVFNITSGQHVALQNTKSFQVKSLYSEPLLFCFKPLESDHLTDNKANIG